MLYYHNLEQNKFKVTFKQKKKLELTFKLIQCMIYWKKTLKIFNVNNYQVGNILKTYFKFMYTGIMLIISHLS